MDYINDIVKKLEHDRDLTDGEFLDLLRDKAADAELACAADRVRRSIYSDEVYIRGLIEFTNYCKNNEESTEILN